MLGSGGREHAIAWKLARSPQVARVHVVPGNDGMLDEDGTLGIATVSAQGLKVLARASILENLAWTPPTLIGRTLYVRDRKTIAAYDLG